ncbi:MAG: PD-(D/E)XK nuclease family protein [Thermoplasmata archaeon]
MAVGVRAVRVGRHEARAGALVSVDEGPGRAPLLRSERYGLAGRPDEVRRLKDGRHVPVELKSRTTPRGGPPRSHRVQVWAYCLLLEETTGVPPPFGILRYSDGGEFRLAWDRPARAELLALRADLLRPYDGRATPSVARCTHCRWREACDASAV